MNICFGMSFVVIFPTIVFLCACSENIGGELASADLDTKIERIGSAEKLELVETIEANPDATTWLKKHEVDLLLSISDDPSADPAFRALAESRLYFFYSENLMLPAEKWKNRACSRIDEILLPRH